jgi:RNA polymerase sporulation-specific sigma factor
VDNTNLDYSLTEEELVKLAQKGCEESGEYLIRKYKELAKTKANLYFIAGADRDDIIQEGMIGIFKAIKSYDDTKQTSFRTFVELCINRQILSAIKQAARMKHFPLNTSVSLNKPVSNDSQKSTLAETLSANSNYDPEALLLIKEVMDYIERDGSRVFSDLECIAWNQYMQGKSYIEISKSLGKSPKSIDNAIQRTKRKLAKILNTDR